jgi:HAD superfamily hydrolase (TIGR01509 family)
MTTILCDLDGTLVDTAPLVRASCIGALASLGIVASNLDERPAPDDGVFWTGVVSSFARLRGVSLATVHARRRQLYMGSLVHAQVNKELVQRIRRARLEGSSSALVTNASRVNADAILGTLGIGDLFDIRVCRGDVSQPKPHAEPYTCAMQLLRASPAECCAFEDTDEGIASANAANVGVVHDVRGWQGRAS